MRYRRSDSPRETFPMRVAVLTISDSVTKGEREDLSGPAAVAASRGLGWEVTSALRDGVSGSGGGAAGACGQGVARRGRRLGCAAMSEGLWPTVKLGEKVRAAGRCAAALLLLTVLSLKCFAQISRSVPSPQTRDETP